MNKKGLLLCAKYSVAPNYFGYCGPDENRSLIDHLKEQVADREVQSILSEFDTLFLNLNLIAKENKIDDTFDERVVEAYWVGNALLQQVRSRDYAYLLDEKFKLERKLGKETFGQLKHKVLQYVFYPHHSFHVFNIFKRTGTDPSFHTLHTMDACRIGWGKVIESQRSQVKSQTCFVVTRPLVILKNKLLFGDEITKEIILHYKGKRFVQPVSGDWVSFHWSHICDILNPLQVKSLQFYTQKAIDFYNCPQ